MLGSAVQPGLMVTYKKTDPSDTKEFHDFRWYLAAKSFEQLFQIRICVFNQNLSEKSDIFGQKKVEIWAINILKQIIVFFFTGS